MAHRDLARRCTWRTGNDLGSDHLPQVMTVTVNGCRPRRIRKTRWSFRKADWTAYTQDCETAEEDERVDRFSMDAFPDG